MKILVVDDEALLVKGIRFNLQNDGYEVSRQELRSTGGNCQGDDRQESCSSAGNCQADEQTVVTQLSRP